MTNYRKGYYIENQLKKRLPFAIRSAGSKGDFDIYVITKSYLICVQIKKNITPSAATKLAKQLSNKYEQFPYVVVVVSGVNKKESYYCAENKYAVIIERTTNRMLNTITNLCYFGGVI